MKLRSNPFVAISIALLSATTLQAGILYWDGTDTTAAVPDANGGAGNWATASTNWNNAATGGTAAAWPSTGIDNDAVFGATAGIVTVDAGGVSANDLTFGLTGYTVAGGTLTLNGTTNILTSTVAAAASSAVNLTISAALAGTNGFTKAGLGHVYLSGNNTSLSGTLTINTAAATQTSGVTLSGANAPGGLTQINVNGGGVVADGSFLSLENTSLASGLTVNLTGQGGTGTLGTLRSTVGANVVNGPVNINSALVRISNNGGTSLTLNGAVTTTPASNGCFVRFGSNQGVILTNTGNSWSGNTVLGEGSLYCYPGALPATTNLQIGGSNPADYGTNGTFSRVIGSAAGQVQFGRANDGQRANGFTARGGALTVNLGGAGADLVFPNAFAKTGATTISTPTVTVTDATNLLVGMSVTGAGIPADTLVSTIAGTTVTLNKNATATAAAAALNFFAANDVTRFNSSVIVLNGANADSPLTLTNPLDLNGFARTIQVSANTATLAGGLKNSSATVASLRKTGAGSLPFDPGALYTLTLAGLNTSGGTLELKSGTYTVNGTAGTSAPASTTGFVVATGGTFRLSGATVNATAGTYVFPAGNTAGGNSNFILDSGTFDGGTKEALNAFGAPGTTTINGGLFVCGTFRVAQSTGVLNLNGGTLRTSNLTFGGGTATVNLNGGTLQAKAANSTFISTLVTVAQVQTNGAVIDSNGFAITIPKLLTEDVGSPGGGLTKKGTGILDLAADNSYTGTNLIQGGALRVSATTQLGVSTAPVTVNGGEFGVSGTGIPSISSLARTFTYTTGGFHVGDVTHTLDVDIALTGSAALSKSGPGAIKLSGANDFTGGITMGAGDNGWIEVDSATDLGTGVKVANFIGSSVASIGGIRLLNNVTVSDVALNLAGRNVSAATQHALLNVSGNNLWTGNISIVSGGGTYYLRSDSGRLELSGTLSNAQPASATADTRAFNLEGAGDFLISGSIVDGPNTNRFAALIMEGSGTATLTGVNTYTGATSVTTGTLALVGGSQKSPITVSSGATLGLTVGSPTTSTSTVTFDGATAKVKVSGTPAAATLMTASSITGTPVLDPAITGYELQVTATELKLVSTAPAANYSTWATNNGVSGQAANLDHDNDGVSNGVEYFMGGTILPAGNTTGFTALPGVITTGGVRSVTWVKSPNYPGTFNADYFVETSETLTGTWAVIALGAVNEADKVNISGNNVTYTFPAGPVKKFARLKVTGP